MLMSLVARIVGGLLLCPPDVIDQSLPMVAPFPSSLKELKLRREVDRILDTCWNYDDGYEVQLSDEWLVDGESLLEKNDIRPSTYGEVTSVGARQLFQQMGMETERESNKEIVFFDLGSGAGKLVVQAHLELANLSKAFGIELSPSRHECALNAWGKVQREETVEREQSKSVVKWMVGDLFQADLSEATHIYVSSLCFTSEMIRKLELKLLRGAPKLRCVASLTKFGENMGNPKVSYIQMSWTNPNGSPVYFYELGKE
jgi:hypothetical protein